MVKKMRKILLICGLVVLLGMVACDELPTNTQSIEQAQQETNQFTLIQNQPAPQLTKSLERENLIKRLQLLNDENKVFYVYLVSYGKVMAFYTAKGKVSSLNSYLTSSTNYVRNYECYSTSQQCWYEAESPDFDGTYGQNTDGVFFFTTDGAYVEWRGEYMVSDYPLKLSTPAELVKSIN